MMKPTHATQQTTLLSIADVNFSRNGKTILQDINMSVCTGEIVTLIGPNGAGKSTLIRIALGLVKADSGMVEQCNNLSIGYVPQNIKFEKTLPLTVSRFLQLDRRSHKSFTALLEQSGMPELQALRDTPLQSLSGGEIQRVLFARALSHNPNLLVLDEPGSGMDIPGQSKLYRLIQTIRDQHNCGILLVSHDLYMVMAATDRVFCLNRHLCCSGQPEDVRRHPEFAALFGTPASTEFALYHHQHEHEQRLHNTGPDSSDPDG